MSFQIVKLTDPIQFTNVAGGLVPKGAYAAGTDYAVGDSVDYNGSSYVMFNNAVAGTLPTDTTYWQVLANKGATGATGSTGATGAAGVGVPAGGTVGQSLTKVDGTDYNTTWTTVSGGGAGGHMIQENATPLAARTNLNFSTGILATDNAGADSTDITVTPTLIGLGNVNNTTDADKIVSTPTQTALNLKVPYTGATASVDLGGFDLTASALFSTDYTVSNGGGDYLNISSNNINFYQTSAETVHLYGDVTNTLKIAQGASSSIYSGLNVGSLTAARTHTLPDVTGTLPVGTGTANEIAFWSGTNTIGTLPVATYPSLTELTYVKGVTSAIQTQINAKQASDATLTALAAYNTNGSIHQTAADTFVGRTLTAGSAKLTVTNGDGVAGNPTVNFGAVASTDLSDTAVVGRSSNNLSFFAATTSAQLAGVISDETGTDKLVFNTSPTFVTQITTPVIYGDSAASGTLSLKGTTDSTRGFIKALDVIEAIAEDRTLTAAVSAMYHTKAARTITLDFVSAQAPNMINNAATYVLKQSANAFGLGTLFGSSATYVNDSTVAANLAIYYTYVDQGTFKADTQAITMSTHYSLRTQPVFTIANGGTMTMTSMIQVSLGGTVNTGVTLTNRYGVKIDDLLGSGTVTNNIGIYIPALTRGGTINYGIQNLSSTILGSTGQTTIDSNGTWKPRVGSTTSSATPTINTDNVELYSLTAQAAAITSFTTNLSGTPYNGQKLTIRIKDNGTARAITWGASFVAGGVALPTTTVLSKIMHVGFIYNTDNSLNKWQCIAVAQEF